jgi:hypothetical protein
MKLFATLFMIGGIVVFNVNASEWFPAPAGGGINHERIFWAGVVGAVCAGLGGLLGMVCDGGKK